MPVGRGQLCMGTKGTKEMGYFGEDHRANSWKRSSVTPGPRKQMNKNTTANVTQEIRVLSNLPTELDSVVHSHMVSALETWKIQTWRVHGFFLHGFSDLLVFLCERVKRQWDCDRSFCEAVTHLQRKKEPRCRRKQDFWVIDQGEFC